jgi:hypothetical protein
VRLLEAIPATRVGGCLRRLLRLPIRGLRARFGRGGTLAVRSPVIEAVAVTPLIAIATEGPVWTIAIVPGILIRPGVLPVRPRVLSAVLPHRLLRLRLGEGLAKGVIPSVAAVLIPVVVAAVAQVAGVPHAMAVAVQALGALRIELLAIGHDDPAVVFGMLEVILCQHRVAGRLSIPRQGEILLGDVSRRAPDFHIRAVRLKAA